MSEGVAPSAPRFLWGQERERNQWLIYRVMEVALCLDQKLMYRFPLPRPGRTTEDNSRPQTSFLKGSVLVVGRFSSLCSYQVGDCVWEH